MKTIDTLIPDIYKVIEGHGGWDETVTKFLSDGISEVAAQRFTEAQKPRNYLSLSSLGTPCHRKLWYKINESEKAEKLTAESLGTFFYGDLLEVLVIALAKAAGHKVEGMQDTVEVHGIKGHIDCIIDGVMVDVKSASKYSFEKFKNHELEGNDPFGYVSQLSSYLYAAKTDKRVINKHEACFLVVQKDRFKLCLDRYDFTQQLKNKGQEVENIKSVVSGPIPTDRIPPVPQSKTSPNTKLDIQCSYCEFRATCYPEARKFIYSTGPLFLVDVNKLPNVPEVI
jgi:hypothetical protein